MYLTPKNWNQNHPYRVSNLVPSTSNLAPLYATSLERKLMVLQDFSLDPKKGPDLSLIF